MEFCEFLAEDELIEIVPNFTHNKVLNLINGDFGPFKPATPTQVPLWMAVNLLKQQKCKIKLPDWILELDKLTQEQAVNEGLIKMPSNHWREVIKTLESNDVPIPHNYSSIFERRDCILMKSVSALLNSVIDLDEDRIAQIKIRNITKFELETLKKIIIPNLKISKNIHRESQKD